VILDQDFIKRAVPGRDLECWTAATLYALSESQSSSRHSGIKNQMGLFSNSSTAAAKAVPQSFDLGVLRRRANEVRLQHSQASARLFDMCYSIQKTGRLPDPEDFSHTLGTFRQARAMAELLEKMQIDVQL
jgi:hypothetical protein